MGLPPSSAGGVQLTLADAFPAVAITLVGAPGGPVGMTLFEAGEAGPVPAALVAVTANVYAVPLLRPLTVAVVPDVEAVKPPGDDVTV